MADRAREGRWGHLGSHLAGVGRKGRDKPLFGHWLLELPGTQAEVEDGGAGDGGDLPMVSRVVCVCVSGGFGVCVEGAGGKVVFEEILWQLKISLGGSNKAGLLKIWIKGEQIFLRLRGMQRRE